MAAETSVMEEDQIIQEKTVSSVTEEDLKKKPDASDEEPNAVSESNGTEMEEAAATNTDNVQASDNPVDDEKNSSEMKANEEDAEKAENVTSTEAGPTDNLHEEKKNGTEEKNEDEANKKDDGLGATVAKHYNEIPAGTKELRKDSRIFHLRNFNNWVKSVLINEYLEKVKRRKRTSDDTNILDLACGKGGDLLKWQKGKVDHVIMADIAATSIEQCQERYARIEKEQKHNRHSRDRLFTIETFAADCTKESLKEKYKKADIKLDLTSCQFAFHYSFESYEQADMMLKNACENLRPGGYFIGTTPDAQKLVKHIKGCKADSFGNSVYNIKPENNEKFPLFGSKYMFYLEGVVECPEFIVYMPALEKLAEKYNMKLIWKKNFHDLFKQYERQYSSLLHKMNAMEQYPAAADKSLTGGSESQYKSAKDYVDSKSSKNTRVGTLSADEWEVAGLYLAFVFEKMEPPREGRATERDDRKRHRDGGSRSREHHEKRKSSESSSAPKRSKKASEVEEVYEVKDEIYEEETDKTQTSTAQPSQEASAEDKESDAKEAAQVTESAAASDAQKMEEVVEETGTEVKESEDVPVEVGNEATEETA